MTKTYAGVANLGREPDLDDQIVTIDPSPANGSPPRVELIATLHRSGNKRRTLKANRFGTRPLTRQREWRKQHSPLSTARRGPGDLNARREIGTATREPIEREPRSGRVVRHLHVVATLPSGVRVGIDHPTRRRGLRPCNGSERECGHGKERRKA
ncbi:MAG: hypothetical protein EBT64_04185 [Gammaproteobacteria bacterium]|nr:hypothetical protein [Gammaproteobacteria bacterium]